MDRLKALTDHYGYSPLVFREGSIHDISIADLTHALDEWWDVKLILYPPPDDLSLFPNSLKMVSEFIEELKEKHIDYSGLIELGYAISVYDFPDNPYLTRDRL